MKFARKTVVVSLIALVCLVAFTVGANCAQSQSLSFKGTVQYIALEGGFWGIVSEDGKNYDPINLVEDFKKNGLRVQVEAKVQDRVGFHMWGTYIEIVNIS